MEATEDPFEHGVRGPRGFVEVGQQLVQVEAAVGVHVPQRILQQLLLDGVGELSTTPL